ncbi:Protein SRG1 [Dichanthelium oligosanthes]|uniref:Protein SRG1 n=1 Tax=Dichanthelium oligosanthes TaxID=888268 RepID=A0A1E5WBR8_9POAL|nr:Protein SRG1 [Dichanthelium oligosanthes]
MFIRTDEVEAAGAVVGEDEAFELPVVDRAKFLDPELSASETAKLGSACRDRGFFQLTSHGVDEAVIQRMKESATEFFSLPLESKNAIAFRQDNTFQGFGHQYNRRPGDKMDWGECVLLLTQPVQDRNMEPWPAIPPAFREALDNYSVEVTELARRLLGYMASDLGVSHEALLGAFFSGNAGKAQSVAIHRYPPCRHPEKVVGLTPHTDGLGLTVLLHVDDTPGLQVKRGGRWFPVRPLPGAFVINVGDILDVLTNGAYGSAEHRVMPNAEKGRTSVVIF